MINKKLSFVGNSGVKFGNQPDNKPYEAAIIDNDSFDAMVGGIKEEHFIDHTYPNDPNSPDANADDIHAPSYDIEPLNRLMTGVEYGGGYQYMSDTVKPVSADATDFLAAHSSNLARTNRHMRLRVERTSATVFRMQIYVNQVLCYDEHIVTAIDKFSFQSHWGSGVVFSNMKITELLGT